MFFHFLLVIIMFTGAFCLFNWLMGYKKGNIIIDLDDRYIQYSEYVSAIQRKLESEGRDVTYLGDRRFSIDGKNYMFIERNVSMGGVPMQRTILKLEK
ncbi:hypothetical protein [Gracilibacillus thailandensis]|jgi:hypothetical protein|uniref:Uncharacterized protein n=1 Tax=Gracilibacillus thailandensis TaxID=563735 RepID=A0A6N7QWU6_9BACI|nr:hypothetical protein [Gracilibacillus thailandensis]MRI65200.1 hypothetical protein [Gracilibacillus thailandensis]